MGIWCIALSDQKTTPFYKIGPVKSPAEVRCTWR